MKLWSVPLFQEKSRLQKILKDVPAAVSNKEPKLVTMATGG
jgi:hypothetical protein